MSTTVLMPRVDAKGEGSRGGKIIGHTHERLPGGVTVGTMSKRGY